MINSKVIVAKIQNLQIPKALPPPRGRPSTLEVNRKKGFLEGGQHRSVLEFILVLFVTLTAILATNVLWLNSLMVLRSNYSLSFRAS